MKATLKDLVSLKVAFTDLPPPRVWRPTACAQAGLWFLGLVCGYRGTWGVVAGGRECLGGLERSLPLTTVASGASGTAEAMPLCPKGKRSDHDFGGRDS